MAIRRHTNPVVTYNLKEIS